MSQIDKLTYLPVLFWFLLFFISFYIALYSFFVPLVISIAKTREWEYSLVAEEAISFFSLIASLQLFFSVIYKAPRLFGLFPAHLSKLLSCYA